MTNRISWPQGRLAWLQYSCFFMVPNNCYFNQPQPVQLFEPATWLASASEARQMHTLLRGSIGITGKWPRELGGGSTGCSQSARHFWETLTTASLCHSYS